MANNRTHVIYANQGLGFLCRPSGAYEKQKKIDSSVRSEIFIENKIQVNQSSIGAAFTIN